MKYLLEYIGALLLILERNSVYSQPYYNTHMYKQEDMYK